jgi:hypothetical protein
MNHITHFNKRLDTKMGMLIGRMPVQIDMFNIFQVCWKFVVNEVHLFPILDLTIGDLTCFTVPLLKISSQDDFLVKKHVMNALEKCTVNPNVIVVKTKCGGHLGWQESPPDGKFGLGKSWATTAAAEFISAVLEMRSFEAPKNTSPGSEAVIDERKLMLNAQSLVEDMYSLKKLTSKL